MIPPSSGTFVKATGKSIPPEAKSPTTYPDQPAATVLQVTVYSKIKFQPTINARNSPNDAYV